jgi:putative ABC transport system permease protein
VRALSSLGSKSLAHRKGRSLLTGLGIVLGVAILFGVLVSNATTQKGVDNLIEDFTGRADVVTMPIGAFDAKVPPGTIEKLRTLPEVRDVVGEFGFGTVLPEALIPEDKRDEGGGNGFSSGFDEVFVSGIVPAEAQKIQNFEFTQGRFARPGADEIVISEALSKDIGLDVGDKIELRGRAQERELLVVGLLEKKGAGRVNDGHGMFGPVDVVRAMDGEGADVFNGASVILASGTDVDDWIDEHRDAVPGVRFQNAETLARGFREFLTVFGTFLTFFAAITLFVGAFLIYLTLSMAVIERTRMYGTLRALGATRKQVRRVVLTEALALGLVSSVIGLLLGLGLALGLLQLIGGLFELDLPGLVVSPAAAIAAVGVGLIVTTISALVPAVRAGRLAPVEAMKGDYARDTRLGRAWMAGAALMLVSIVLQFLLPGQAGSVAVIGILFGAVLLTPLLLRPLASLLGRVTNRLARGVGEIAVLHLAKERSRSAYTLALVMVVMAMLFATGGMFLSVRAGINELVESQFGADLFVNSRTPDDGSLQGVLDERADIDVVSPIRIGIASSTNPEGEKDEIFVNTIEPATYFEVSSFYWKEGDDHSAKAALERGGAILLSDEISRTFDVDVGEDFEIETAKGIVGFEVAATYTSSFGPPEITMGIRDAREHLSAGRPEGYLVQVVEGQDPAEVAERLEALPDRQLETETQSELQKEASTEVGTFFQIIYAILLIAAIVGLLGLANTLAMSVLHRFREIGILRAIGVTRSQTWRMVLVESATMGLTAFVLSLPLGFLLTFLVVNVAGDGFGTAIPTVYPWLWIPFVFVFGVVIAVIAAIAPGRRAARLHVVNALQYE